MLLVTLALALSSALIQPAKVNSLRSPSVLEGHSLQRRSTKQSGCRCFPGDACWPEHSEWNAFNQSLGGKLIATVPIASVCHDTFGSYDAEGCAKLKSIWFYPKTHFDTSSSIMAPYFTNDSCNPFLPRDAPCSLGNYIVYAVNASDAEDFKKTIKFTQRHNIRLTIRNTGHDYNGKATGAGAVGIWTHHMRSMKIFDYRSSTYNGKAMKVGAGVQATDAYRYAHNRSLVVVGGNCPTVGIAGGYTQGGGHSPLSSKFGMAADQALEWEVVTATGEHLMASQNHHADLYWALSGGGGGTYGIVVSLTIKAHPDLLTSSAKLTFSSIGIDPDSFWGVVKVFQQTLPTIVDSGTYASFVITNESFTISPIQGPGISQTQLQELLSPTISTLKREKISYELHIGEFPTFLDSYNAYDPPWNVSEEQLGGRLIPRSLLENNLTALVEAERKIIDIAPAGSIISAVCVNVSVANASMNSVNPAWRTAIFDAVLGTPYSYTNTVKDVTEADLATHTLLPILERLTPGGGAYVSEADFQQPDFQQVFYGNNYPKLKAIKNKYDPHDTLYAITAVDSEGWYEDQAQGGRLCPVGNKG